MQARTDSQMDGACQGEQLIRQIAMKESEAARHASSTVEPRISRRTFAIKSLEFWVFLCIFLAPLVLGGQSSTGLAVGGVAILSYGFAIVITRRAGIHSPAQAVPPALLVGVFLRAMLVILNYQWCVVQSGVEPPYPFGADSKLYHELGLALIQSDGWDRALLRRSNAWGYPILLLYLYRLFSPNILVGQLANLCLGTVNIALTGVLTRELSDSSSAGTAAVWLAAVSPLLIRYDTLLLKESVIVTGVLLACLPVARILTARRGSWIGTVLLAGGIVSLAVNRPVLLLIPLAVSLLSAYRAYTFRWLAVASLVAVFFVVGASLAGSFNRGGFGVHSITMLEEWSTEYRWHETSSEDSLVIGLFYGYSKWPIYQRLATLPLTMLFQYLAPFRFWDLTFDRPDLFAFRVGNLVWYIWIGPLCIFGYLHLRQNKSTTFKRFATVGLVAYMLLSLITVGSHPRYEMSLMPLLLCAGGWGWTFSWSSEEARQRWRRFYHFYMAIAIVAVVAYLLWKSLV